MTTYSSLINPTPEQIKQITELYRMEGWWEKEKDDQELVAGIIKGSHCFFIAVREEEIIGMGRAISDQASDAYIQDVAVKSESRRKGIGTVIIREITARLRADGLNWIGIIAERGSQEFYSRLGFKVMPDSMPMLKTIP